MPGRADTPGRAWTCLDMPGHAWASLDMPGHAWTCLDKQSRHVQAYAGLSRHVQACAGVSRHVQARPDRCLGDHFHFHINRENPGGAVQKWFPEHHDLAASRLSFSHRKYVGTWIENAALICVRASESLYNGPRGVTVSTLDSESSDRGSNPREALFAYGHGLTGVMRDTKASQGILGRHVESSMGDDKIRILMVSISACRAEDPGAIPGGRVFRVEAKGKFSQIIADVRHMFMAANTQPLTTPPTTTATTTPNHPHNSPRGEAAKEGLGGATPQ